MRDSRVHNAEEGRAMENTTSTSKMSATKNGEQQTKIGKRDGMGKWCSAAVWQYKTIVV